MLVWHWPHERVCVTVLYCATFSSRRTHTTAIYSVENFNGIFCILNTTLYVLVYRISNPIWMIENCIRNSLFMIYHQHHLYHHGVCTTKSIGVLFACIYTCYYYTWAECTDVTHFCQFSSRCNLIATVNFQATLHIWLERFIIIAHPVKFWINSYIYMCRMLKHFVWYITCNGIFLDIVMYFSAALCTFRVEDICLKS